MQADTHDLQRLYDQIDALRAKAASMGLPSLDAILTTALSAIACKLHVLQKVQEPNAKTASQVEVLKSLMGRGLPRTLDR